MSGRDIFWKVRSDLRRSDYRIARRADVFPYFLEVESPLDREVVVKGTKVLMFGSNNYLGLANDDRVKSAAMDAIDRYGAACTGSRLMNGTLAIHRELEEEIADWTGREASVVFTAGYLANLGTVMALAHRGDVVVTDARNHASIQDGARISAADVVSVRHDDLDQLDRKLERLGRDGAAVLVTWDVVF